MPRGRTAIGVGVLAAGLLLAVGVTGALAAQQSAPDYTDRANHTVDLPHTSDHYPGDRNPGNATVHSWFAGADGFEAEGAEDGIWAHDYALRADWIDYSACDETNVDAWGVDRGNDNAGTTVDEEYDPRLLGFDQESATAEFYGWDAVPGNPPYLAPEDAIVLGLGASEVSTGCLTMTGEPGWYRATAYVNGTVANGSCTEQGNPACEPDDKRTVAIRAKSTYVYICDCENESEARDELGPPPSEADPTPTMTPTATPTPTPTPTATPTPTLTSTATPSPTVPAAAASPTDTPTPTPTATPADTTTSTASPPPSDAGGLGLPAMVFAGLAAVLGTVLVLREVAI